VLASPDEAVTVRGSGLSFFTFGFVLIFGVMSLVVLLPLYWSGNIFFRGVDVYGWLAGYAALSALFAWFLAFQVCTSVTLSSQGIHAKWRGPFGGHSTEKMLWSDLKEIKVVRFHVACTVSSRASPLDTLFVTFGQARAILSHPMCPSGAATPKVADTVGASSAP